MAAGRCLCESAVVAWSLCAHPSRWRGEPSQCVSARRAPSPSRTAPARVCAAGRPESRTQDITNNLTGCDSAATLAGKKTLKSERKADDVDARDASNPQAVTEYVNDMCVSGATRSRGRRRARANETADGRAAPSAVRASRPALRRGAASGTRTSGRRSSRRA